MEINNYCYNGCAILNYLMTLQYNYYFNNSNYLEYL